MNGGFYNETTPCVYHRRCFQRPALDRLSRLCFFSGKRRGYILQSRPLSQEWERAWGLG